MLSYSNKINAHLVEVLWFVTPHNLWIPPILPRHLSIIKCWHPTPHHSPRPTKKTTSTPLSVALFLWFNGWLYHIWCFFTSYYGSTHVDIWYLSTRRTLCVIFNKVSNLLWSDIMRYFASTLTRYHTHK